MSIKIKKPVKTTEALFDKVEPFDVRFRQNVDNKWLASVKYRLFADNGEESESLYEDKIYVDDTDIKKLEKLIARIVDGKVI